MGIFNNWKKNFNPKEDYLRGFESGRKNAFSTSSKPVLIVGMGGSGIAGSVLATFSPKNKKIHSVNDYYEIESFNEKVNGKYKPKAFLRNPKGWANLILCSYSGNTEETLSWLKVVSLTSFGITTGGKLAEACPRKIKIIHPGPPRRSLYESLGILDGLTGQGKMFWDGKEPKDELVEKIIAKGTEWGKKKILPWMLVPEKCNPIARRWTGMMQEDAKIPAGFGTLPEAAHNQIEGLGGKSFRMGLILIDAESTKNENKKLLKVFREKETILLPQIHPVQLCILGDYFATAIAEGSGMEIDPIPTINKYKES